MCQPISQQIMHLDSRLMVEGCANPRLVVERLRSGRRAASGARRERLRGRAPAPAGRRAAWPQLTGRRRRRAGARRRIGAAPSSAPAGTVDGAGGAGRVEPAPAGGRHGRHGARREPADRRAAGDAQVDVGGPARLEVGQHARRGGPLRAQPAWRSRTAARGRRAARRRSRRRCASGRSRCASAAPRARSPPRAAAPRAVASVRESPPTAPSTVDRRQAALRLDPAQDRAVAGHRHAAGVAHRDRGRAGTRSRARAARAGSRG